MANKPKFVRPALDRAVEALYQRKQSDTLTPYDIAAQAKISGYSTRHIRRALNARTAGASGGGCPPGTGRFEVTEEIVTRIFLNCGRLEGVHRHLKKEGKAVPSLSTFKRAVHRELGADQLAYARGGSAAYRDAQIYLRQDYPHRMHTVQLDHTELPIYVVPRGHKHAVKPWMTVVMDAATRYPLSWVITYGRPTSEEVRAALVQAMTLRLAPDGVTVVGGRPLKAVWDRGLEFLATLITESCLRLNVMPVALPAYSPHLKGRLERFWRFLKEDLLPPLPGYVEGPRDIRGNTALESHCLGADELLILLADWMDGYVTDHVIRTAGATPLQMWRQDATPLEEIAEEQLWQDFLLSKDRCKVSKNGIRWDGIDWIAPELRKAGGQLVDIRYLPHDRTFIEVFRDGEHLCTAEPNEHRDDESDQLFLQRRHEARRQAQKRFTTANRLRRTGHDETHKLVIEKDGRRSVVTPPDDLLSGGQDALKQLLHESTGDDASRLF